MPKASSARTPPPEYSIADARNNLASLVHEAEEGKPVRLTRRGEAVAIILSLKDYERLQGRPSFMERVEHFRLVHDLDQLDAESAFADLRDPSPGRDFQW